MKASAIACLVMVFAAVQFSCTKTKKDPTPEIQDPPISMSDLLTCYNSTSWDTAAIHNAVIGKWDWEYIKCYWNPEDANYDDYTNISVEFKADNTVDVIDNGTITQTSTWKVTDTGDGYFAIISNPIVVYTTGHALFCSGRVVFADTYTDGCDNYFVAGD